jgi:hypothetical protein
MRGFARASMLLASILLPVAGAQPLFASPALRHAVVGSRSGDFDGDGFADLAVGVPGEDTPTVDGGAVNVIYGSSTGLTSAGDQLWTQDSDGIVGTSGAGDSFGSSVEVGDFNGDGFGDLAVGVPSDDVGTALDAGGVNVLYGSARGLSAQGNQLWAGDTLAVGLAASERFGNSLAAGDFDGDGHDDLAIGVPGRTVGGMASAGGVEVVYGSDAGLTAVGNAFLSQGGGGLPGSLGAGDSVGDVGMTAADLGRGPEDDLAIGNPLDDIGATDDGSVDVLYGSATGLTSVGAQLWDQDSAGILGKAEAGDLFGWDVTGADFGMDGVADLAIGTPGEDLGTRNSIPAAGAVNVLYGSAAGLTDAGNQLWTQDSPGVPGVPAPGDGFGNALGSGDLGRSGQADLVIAAARDDVGSVRAAGTATILYGGIAGLSSDGSQIWDQDSAGVLDVAEGGDDLGCDVAVADFDGSAAADVALGVCQEHLGARGNITFAGATNVLYGTPEGVDAAGNDLWDQDSSGILDRAEPFDGFGASATSG